MKRAEQVMRQIESAKKVLSIGLNGGYAEFVGQSEFFGESRIVFSAVTSNILSLRLENVPAFIAWLQALVEEVPT